MKTNSLLMRIGNTPLINPQNFLSVMHSAAAIFAKYEGFNPAGSIKDRAALAMIEAGERSGQICPETVIIEATSGNTGIGLALVCAQRGYRLLLTMPENMSIERRNLLQAMGAELILTKAADGMQGAVDKANELLATLPSAYMVSQFTNPANADAHYHTTGPEIWEALAGNVDVLVATIGSGGTISGCGRYLKERHADIQIIGVEPAESPLLSQGIAGPHLIQGIGANFIPAVLDRDIIDEIVTVKGQEAMQIAKLFGQTEGYLVGISSGAALSAALAIAEKPSFANKNIVTILPDRGERYMSTPLFQFTDK
ncbi:MAG: cysteine synthase A [Firmicutes bacterium]|nr:cysteine synthase A [Bacillota bacterium]